MLFSARNVIVENLVIESASGQIFTSFRELLNFMKKEKYDAVELKNDLSHKKNKLTVKDLEEMIFK